MSRCKDLGLAVAEEELEVGAGVGGSGGDGAPLDMPAPPRNWSRKAATLLLLLEEDGGWVIGGEGACEVVDELWMRAVLTALNGVDPPMLFRLLLEKLRAGVGGGGGFTDGRDFGGLGAHRMLPALVLWLDSLPWNCSGPRIVPKCCWVGNTGPLTLPTAGGDLGDFMLWCLVTAGRCCPLASAS